MKFFVDIFTQSVRIVDNRGWKESVNGLMILSARMESDDALIQKVEIIGSIAII